MSKIRITLGPWRRDVKTETACQYHVYGPPHPVDGGNYAQRLVTRNALLAGDAGKKEREVMMQRPILFKAEMVNAILQGRKTQTRRIVKNQTGWPHAAPWSDSEGIGISFALNSNFDPMHSIDVRAPYRTGDYLWVRETWAENILGCPGGITYRADHIDPSGDGPANPIQWKPSIFLPRQHSRITLEITDVRVERVQEISAYDALKEGLKSATKDGNLTKYGVDSMKWYDWDKSPVAAFAFLWDQINGKKAPWASNPWVFAITFRRVESAQKQEAA